MYPEHSSSFPGLGGPGGVAPAPEKLCLSFETEEYKIKTKHAFQKLLLHPRSGCFMFQARRRRCLPLFEKSRNSRGNYFLEVSVSSSPGCSGTVIEAGLGHLALDGRSRA